MNKLLFLLNSQMYKGTFIAIKASAIIVITTLCSYAQNQSIEYRTIHVKFKEDLKPTNPINARTSQLGVQKIDNISQKHNAFGIRRIFPDAGVFETAHREFGLHLWYEFRFPKNTQLKNIIREYQTTAYFDIVEESRPYSSIHINAKYDSPPTLPSGSNDPLFPNQWHFNNEIPGIDGKDINLFEAWKKETGSPNVIVAVFDGGIELNHPDLRDALWRNNGEIPGNEIDDDNNGYVDDVHGYGFGDRSSAIHGDDHGTHVAGIIGAVSNNGIGISGIAGGDGTNSGVKLMTLAGFGRYGNGGFEEAMVYAADNGAVISQNSWGGGSTAIEAAIDYFIARAGYDNTQGNFSKNIQTGPMAGGIVIFAAGNSNISDPYYVYPATYEKVIAVASTDPKDVKSSFSNFGSWVDISAPGTNIFSTTRSSYTFYSGTSMACPHVSGVAALIVSHLQRQGLKPNEVWNRLRFSARPIDSMNPNYKEQLGWGRVDASVALREPDTISPGPITNMGVQEVHSTSLLLKWTASGENNQEGQTAEYEIRYSTSPIDESNFSTALLVPKPPIPPFSGEQVVFEVNNLSPNTTYYFALKSIDIFLNVSPLSNIISIRTLQLPIPQQLTSEISKQLYTGATSTQSVFIKNIGEDKLLMRTRVPQIQPGSVLPPLGTKGRLFSINTSTNKIEELDTKSGKVIHSIDMPEPSSKTIEGLAFDGTHLYYGRSKTIYKINSITGKVIRTLSLENMTGIKGLAWSGKYLYVSGYTNWKFQTLEVDTDTGIIVRSLERYGELAYVGVTNSLILTTDYSRIDEVDLETGNLIRTIPIDGNSKCVAYSVAENLIFVSTHNSTLIRAIRPSDGSIAYTITYPSSTALAGDENPLSWLTMPEEVITILGGQVGEIPFTLSSAGLNSGTWQGLVTAIPINVNSPPIQVPVTLDVLSGADIETITEIDFGSTYLGFAIDTTIILENRGFSDLEINQIQSNDNKVLISASYVTLNPGQKIEMGIRIEPDGPGVIDAIITFSSNDPDEALLSIPVLAIINESPTIDLSSLILKTTLNTGTSTALNFTVTNSGKSILNWNTQRTGNSENIVQSEIAEPANDLIQNDLPHETDISTKSPSPVPVHGLVYDPIGELIYAKSHSGDNNMYSYNIITDAWTIVGLAPPNIGSQAVWLNGKLYYGGTQLNVYSIQLNTWISIPFPIEGVALSITTDDNYIFIAIDKILYRFDPTSSSWYELPPVPSVFYMTGFGALSYHSGIIYAIGTQGITGDGNTLFFKYFINSKTWIQSNSILGNVGLGSTIDPSSGRFFVLGSPQSLPQSGIQMSILDIRQGTWARLSTPFPIGGIGNLVYVNKEGFSGVYFSQGHENKFGYYETEAATNWLTWSPTKGSVSQSESESISVNLDAQGLFGGLYKKRIEVFSTKPYIAEFVDIELEVLGKPEIFMSNQSADVGETILGYERGASLMIQNKGTADMTVDTVLISNSDYTISNKKFIIPVGESIYLTTYFKPSEVGLKTGTFTFHGSNSIVDDFQFALTGTGVYPAQLVVPIDTIKVELLTGTYLNSEILITNVGDGHTQYLNIHGLASWIPVNHQFQNINAHSSRSFPITINSNGLAAGIYYSSLWIQDYFDPSMTYFEVPVQLKVMDAPDIYTSKSRIDFGEVWIGRSYDSIIQVKNSGTLPLSITIVNSNPVYTLSINEPLVMQPGELLDLEINFNPPSTGVQSATVLLTTNDPDEGTYIIELTGNGVLPPALSVSDKPLSINIYEGESKTIPLLVGNDGGSNLLWTLNEKSNNQSAANEDLFSAMANTPEKLTGLTIDPATGIMYAQYHYLSSLRLYSFNPQTNKWSPVFGYLPLSGNYNKAGAVILNSKLYCTLYGDSKRIYIYDLKIRDWSSVTNGIETSSATLTTDGTLIYIAGAGKFTSYNPKLRIWNNLPVPNFILDGLGGLSYHEGVIYAHSSTSNDFAKYTIATNIWESLVFVPKTAILGSAIDPVRNRYYAYGANDLNSLFEYDITSGKWTSIYCPLFELGTTGGMAFVNQEGQEGLYFLQGNSQNGCGRYKPKSEIGWLKGVPFIGAIKPESIEQIGITADATNLSPGTYQGNIQIASNDQAKQSVDIPVTMVVEKYFATIEVQQLFTDSIHRFEPYILKIPISNSGLEALNWSIGNITDYLTPDKLSGTIAGESTDTLQLTFIPTDMWQLEVAHNIVILSNDVDNPSVSIDIKLKKVNHSPQLIDKIPDQVLDRLPIEISLAPYFSDADNDVISFKATAGNPFLFSVSVLGENLTITPKIRGVATITVTAMDGFTTTSTSFVASSVITGIEPLDPEFIAVPNPFDEEVTLQVNPYKQNTFTSIVMYDVAGKVVWRSTELEMTSQTEITISTQDLTPGFYYFTLFIDHKFRKAIKVLKK